MMYLCLIFHTSLPGVWFSIILYEHELCRPELVYKGNQVYLLYAVAVTLILSWRWTILLSTSVYFHLIYVTLLGLGASCSCAGWKSTFNFIVGPRPLRSPSVDSTNHIPCSTYYWESSLCKWVRTVQICVFKVNGAKINILSCDFTLDLEFSPQNFNFSVIFNILY